MKQQLATIFTILVVLTGYAQDKNFDLSKYKFPDYKRHELEFNFGSSGGKDKVRYDQPTSQGSESGIKNTESSSNLYANVYSNYTYNFLSRTKIDYFDSYISGVYDSRMRNLSGEKSRYYYPKFDLTINGFKRYYLKEDKLFVEGITKLQNQYSEAKATYSFREDDFRSKNNWMFLSAGFGAGYGRIEQVGDLWQSYFILKELKKKNILSRDLKEEDIFEFATLASKIKNKRFLDARLRKISELEALDSLLHKQNLLENSDISYFTTLNDYWSYGNFADRISGRILKFWLSPEYARSYSKADGNNSNIVTTTNLASNLTFTFAKPLNLHWDRVMSIALANKTLLNKTGNDYYLKPGNLFRSQINFGYGYYPDSRTYLTTSVNYVLEERANIDTAQKKKSWNNNLNYKLEAHYYISPQLQLNGILYGACGSSDYNDSKGFQFYYSLSLRYAIF